ncbi:MAG: zinc-ribbon domain-containing protein [Lachnospiraceae bacterium]|nr:zinc-ribbon domain-containing protein [Lachnospiraceae bacterium]
MFCSKCGAQIADNAAFCKNCGNKLSVSPTAGDTGTAPSDNAKTKEQIKKLIPVIAGIIVLLIVISTIGKGGSNSTPEALVQDYIKAVKSGDIQAYINCFPKEEHETIKAGIEEVIAIESGDWQRVAKYADGWTDSRSPYLCFATVFADDLDILSENITDMPESDIESINKQFGIKAKEGKYVRVKMSYSITHSDGGVGTFGGGTDLPVGKIKGKWYILKPTATTWPNYGMVVD